MDAIVFATSLGLNDSGRLATQVTNPSPRSKTPGATELIACQNITTTETGAIESVPGLATAVTHSAPVLALSAGKRFLYQDATDTKEWDGTNVALRFPLTTGPMLHTPIDCRVSAAANYKSLDKSPVMQLAALGDISNQPLTSKPYAPMPVFNKAFTLNGIAYVVNREDPRFLQYSRYAQFDVFSLADNFMGHDRAILDAGAIAPVKPAIGGSILLMHLDGVTIYAGTSASDFSKNFYPCSPILGTLYSGYVSKALEAGHVFLCADGVYLVNTDGQMVRLTGEKLSHIDTLNATYHGAVVEKGKYLALGNSVCLEYDFITKATSQRTPQGAATTLWNGAAYFAAGNLILKHSGLSTQPTSVTFPASSLGGEGRKGIEDLFVSGRFDGVLEVAATGEEGKTWTITVPPLGEVTNRRLTVPKVYLGNRISFKINTLSGVFRLEQLRATVNVSQRAR